MQIMLEVIAQEPLFTENTYMNINFSYITELASHKISRVLQILAPAQLSQIWLHVAGLRHLDLAQQSKIFRSI